MQDGKRRMRLHDWEKARVLSHCLNCVLWCCMPAQCKLRECTLDQSRGTKLEFYEGVEEFIIACIRIEQFTHEETVMCPCYRCK